mmetsp:Transcript_5065/g.11191  ORF Transcript_5065/g.11191 Transcript_5065/m.11191 type:complete len:254 (-) Transcript_5065:338-1099(-)
MVNLACSGSLERHDHLHGLQLHEELSLRHILTIRLQVPNKLAVEVRAELGGVAHMWECNGGAALDAQTQAKRLLEAGHLHTALIQDDVEGAIRLLANLHLKDVLAGAANAESIAVGAEAADLPDVLDLLMCNLHDEVLHQRQVILQGRMAAADALQDLLLLGLNVAVRAEASGEEDRILLVELGADHSLVGNQLVQPSRVNGVLPELGSLGELNQVLHGVPNLARNEEILQGNLQSLPGFLTVRTLGEDVAKL